MLEGLKALRWLLEGLLATFCFLLEEGGSLRVLDSWGNRGWTRSSCWCSLVPYFEAFISMNFFEDLWLRAAVSLIPGIGSGPMAVSSGRNARSFLESSPGGMTNWVSGSHFPLFFPARLLSPAAGFGGWQGWLGFLPGQGLEEREGIPSSSSLLGRIYKEVTQIKVFIYSSQYRIILCWDA